MSFRFKHISRTSMLQRQVEQLRDELRDAARIAHSALKGTPLEASPSVDAKRSELIRILCELHTSHREIYVRERENRWADHGLVELAEIFKSGSRHEEIMNAALRFLVRYTEGHQAAIFLQNDDTHDGPTLEVAHTYACTRTSLKHVVIDASSGMVGQCFREGRPFYLTDIPANYFKITSGLGEATPTSLILVPLVIHGKKTGVVELAFFRALEKFEISFLEKAGSTFAAFILDVKERTQMMAFAQASEDAAARLRHSESQLKIHMEELERMQQELSRRNQLLEQSNVNLEQKNLELARIKEEDAELLDSKLKASEAIHEMMVARLKNKIQQLMEEKALQY